MDNNSTLLMIGTLAAVAMLSAGLALVPIQHASANDDDDGLSFKQYQKNECKGDASCTNTATITFNPLLDEMDRGR
jgi:hypothetical protein